VEHHINEWAPSPLDRESGISAIPAAEAPSEALMAEVTVMFGRLIDDARAEALFVTDLQRSERPTPEQVRAAIRLALRRHGCDCAALVAAEFGEHPETAVLRMRWALDAVHDAYPPNGDDPDVAALQRMPSFGAA
jgi:hypothetical protein